ncbi:hypothetical protein B0H16DRAFT_1511258 [Mycena metata]|uniref:LIM zinc-binding domain-containing protein n=1 Tax=Mycena metata TaxID=1033252 RepID=A0AAD7NS89_9AGAR|nr:hypothetical protein B0H16DRAFT_1511258 [Mycena metata]
MAQNPPFRSGFVIQPPQQQYQQPYDPRHQYPQYQPPRHPGYPQQQAPPQPQYYQQQQQQAPVPQQYRQYAQPPPHPQYAQPPPPRPRSSLGHAHSHSVPFAPGHHQFAHPPPLSPSALQAQAAQAQLQARGRPLPPPQRAETLPPAASFGRSPDVPQHPQQQQFHPSHAIPSRAPSTSSSSRPLPTPTPSTVIPRSPAKHQSLDLGRFPTQPFSPPAVKPTAPAAQPAPPETASQIRRRASPPRFTGGSGSWSETPPLPSPTVPPKSSNGYKDLLSGAGSTLESGKFVPLWKRGLITNGETNPNAATGRPLPVAPTKGESATGSGLKRGGSLHVRAPATTSVAKSPSPSPEPSDDSESESDVEGKDVQEESEDSESESEVSASEEASSDAGSASLPSPQFGIRDLPRPPSMDARSTSLPQPPEIRGSTFQARSSPGIMEGAGSRTLKFAAALNGAPVRNAWPAGVPPLPRTPGQERGDPLEDSPPVSTIRRGIGTAPSPTPKSPSNFNGPSSPLSKPPSFSFNGPPASTASSSSQPPSFSFNGPPSPSPPTKVPSLSFTAPSSTPQIPTISFPDDSPRAAVPQINLPGVPQINLPGDDDDDGGGPMINVQDVDSKPAAPPQIFEVPGISFAGGAPSAPSQRSLPARPPTASQRRGLACGACNGSIVGRIVNAMGLRWHPECFRCNICNELLEHVSSYERDGKAYCHLDYHENFAPRCYSCKTAIVEERFISLDDPQLGGKRTYHEQHFFCAECGDPFLPPSLPAAKGELAFSGDGAFVSDDVGFTVYRGHPYCEACHVRLRLPKCKKCKRSIRDGDEAVEALGGKFCWGCFCCAGCEKPFDDPSFFERDGKPWCEPCFSIILRNEL